MNMGDVNRHSDLEIKFSNETLTTEELLEFQYLTTIVNYELKNARDLLDSTESMLSRMDAEDANPCEFVLSPNDRECEYFNIDDLVCVIVKEKLSLRKIIDGYRHHDGSVNFFPVGCSGFQTSSVIKYSTFEHLRSCIKCREKFYPFAMWFEKEDKI